MLRTMGMVAVIALAVAGCARTEGSAPASSSNTVTQIQSAATRICSFVPAAQMVASILASGNAGVAGASEIATAICRVANRKSAARGARPTVYGVPLQGRSIAR